MIQLTIDGREVHVQPGTTVMEAALAHGIDIPHLCYHPELSVSAGCRLCLVQLGDGGNPVAACGLDCREGMQITTRSPQLAAMRREILELLILRHPLDCLTCEKAGRCQLQAYAYQYGVPSSGGQVDPSQQRYFDDNPFFIRDLKYCIHCGRCVRACSEVVGAHAIDFNGRGHENRIATALDVDLRETSCVFCGSCVQVCPTAALMPVSRQGRGREWEFERVKTVCGYCGVGCEIEYALEGGEIVYAGATPEGPVNGEFLCTKGRFGWDFAHHRERLTRPLIRKDAAGELGLTEETWSPPETSPLQRPPSSIKNDFIPVDWDTALNFAAGRLAEIVRARGPDAVMGLASARCTNEENYIFQKFMRAGIGTNNVDHCARL